MSTIDDNLQGYRNRVRRWLREINSDVSFWGDTFIDQMINVHYRKRSAQLVMAYEGFFTNIATRDIESGKSRYSWPPGFERLLKMEIVRTDGTTSPIGRFERHYSSNPATSWSGREGYTPTYRAISSGFVLEPEPGFNATDGIRIEYHGLPALLEANGDSWHVDFPRSMDELVILDAVVSCLDSETLLELGATKSVLRARAEWELIFERYVEKRMVSLNKIQPFAPHYEDA